MKKQYKLGFIGCGEHTTSIIRGVVLSEFLKEKKIIVSDESEDELDKLDYLGVHTAVDHKFVAENSEFLIINVKPAKFPSVVKALEGYCPEKIISLMDGVKKSSIKNALGIGLIKVARCAMNAPCSIGSGTIGLEYSDFVKSMDDTDFISNVFNTMGTVVDVSESKMDAINALAKDGCAFSYAFMDAMISAGMKAGLTKDEAKIAVVQTVLGSSELVSRDEQPLEELLMQSCNGSSALEAIKIFENKNLRGIISEALSACIERISETDK